MNGIQPCETNSCETAIIHVSSCETTILPCETTSCETAIIQVSSCETAMQQRKWPS